MPNALSPPLSPTLEATSTPFAPGQLYPPLANDTVSPERSTPQYFPLSQWLQAPWIRGITSQLPDISFPSVTIPMPMPVHYIFKPKKVQLTDGNLVLDTPVPTSYLTAVDYQTGNEFEKLRYMAMTCDADMVPEGRYRLRTQHLKRSVEIAICLTVNEVRSGH
jgi:chitin synthase